jgi:hypothetical protein
MTREEKELMGAIFFMNKMQLRVALCLILKGDDLKTALDKAQTFTKPMPKWQQWRLLR